jgi:hypothetical protein
VFSLEKNIINPTRIGRSLLLVISLLISGHVFAFALPDAQIVIPRYAAVTAPTTNANPVLAKPVAVRSGNVNGALSLQVQLETIDAQADLYIGISAPAINPDTLFLLNEEGKLIPATNKLVPWKRAITSVDENIPLGIALSN